MKLILILRRENDYHALIFNFKNNASDSTIHHVSFGKESTLQTSLSQCRDEILASLLLSLVFDKKTTEQISLGDLNDFYGYNLVTMIVSE